MRTEAWALLSSSLPLIIVRRIDDNTMLPGRGTAVELAFSRRYRQVFTPCNHTPLVSCSLKV